MNARFRYLFSMAALLLFACECMLYAEIIVPKVNLPQRSPKAACASTLMKKYDRLNAAQREFYMMQQVLKGNVPSFLRDVAEVTIYARDGVGNMRMLNVFVLRDYLAVGCDTDFVRVPLRPLSAQKIGDRLNFMLPTTKLVDAIYRQATRKLTPMPLPASRRMMSVNYILNHNKAIQKVIEGSDYAGSIFAGHKKDIVLTPKLLVRPKRVAIYGWHQGINQVIQPLSLVHSNQYLDYSHGVRLVARKAYLDGVEVDLVKVLRDPLLTVLLQDESKRAPATHLAYK